MDQDNEKPKYKPSAKSKGDGRVVTYVPRDLRKKVDEVVEKSRDKQKKKTRSKILIDALEYYFKNNPEFLPS